MEEKRFYGFRAERKSMDAKLNRLKKALRRRSVTDVLITIINEADEKILNQSCVTTQETGTEVQK